MLEKMLIIHCAPTLAGIKTGNLFNCRTKSSAKLRLEVLKANRKLKNKGICLEILRIKNSSALILVYRPNLLMKDLRRTGSDDFLARFGYQNVNLQYAISRLKKRFAEQTEFPHEIGLFLGYPLKDVIGFIENGGQNSKCAGCWKVYCNETEAMKRFDQYRKCGDVYLKMFGEGHSIMKLAVAA